MVLYIVVIQKFSRRLISRIYLSREFRENIFIRENISIYSTSYTVLYYWLFYPYLLDYWRLFILAYLSWQLWGNLSLFDLDVLRSERPAPLWASAVTSAAVSAFRQRCAACSGTSRQRPAQCPSTRVAVICRIPRGSGPRACSRAARCAATPRTSGLSWRPSWRTQGERSSTSSHPRRCLEHLITNAKVSQLEIQNVKILDWF